MSEQALQRECIKYLESQGFYVVKVISANKTGIPDLLSCIHGRFIVFELKLEYNELSELQKYNFRKIKAAGGQAYMIKSLKQLKTIVELITDQKFKS